jgi:hypothetical protein
VKEVLVSAQHSLTRFLHGEVPLYAFLADVGNGANGVPSTPQTRKLGVQESGSVSLEMVVKTVWRFSRETLDQPANVIGQDFKRLKRQIQFLRLLVEQGERFLRKITYQHLAAILRTTHEGIFPRENATFIKVIPRIIYRTSVR